jgi:hypothetical protein
MIPAMTKPLSRDQAFIEKLSGIVLNLQNRTSSR